MLLSPWSLHAALSALAIVFLAGFTAQLLVRRPLAQLWPTLPLSFFAALLFSIGDLASVLSAQVSPTMHWVGLIVLYTGLVGFYAAVCRVVRGQAEEEPGCPHVGSGSSERNPLAGSGE
jgi:hypothetical protein